MLSIFVDRTASVWKYVADATRHRHKMLQTGYRGGKERGNSYVEKS